MADRMPRKPVVIILDMAKGYGWEPGSFGYDVVAGQWKTEPQKLTFPLLKRGKITNLPSKVSQALLSWFTPLSLNGSCLYW